MPVLVGVWRHLGVDARHAQIGALAGLLAINIFAIEFGATPLASALARGPAC
jgi:hypothetical protein